ncbi:MAG: Ku domain protein [Bacteroidetes bacterium]|nr:Ku domain protein [Bacteroidota bacterium]
MRPIWTGSISFGLINIPVKLFSATEDSSLDLDMLDSRDHANIKFKRVNEKTGKEVPYEKITKGYLYHDKYVVLEEEDFKSADAKKTQLIEIQSFANADEIDPIYFEQPYYLAPDKSGAKAYALLREALAASSKVGVTTFVMRNKEALAILKPYGKVIVLNRIRFEQEIRNTTDLNLPTVSKGKTKEQDMAEKLIDQLTEKFDISAFKDTYTDKLLKSIHQKAKSRSKKTTEKPMKVVYKKTEDDDLMNMLKASLGGGTKRKKAS